VPHGFLYLFLLPGKIGHGAASFLGGMGRHLATVNGEHVLADQVHYYRKSEGPLSFLAVVRGVSDDLMAILC
jgi:hypothetical protein